MPVNQYFQSGNGIGNAAEQRLHEDLIIESLRQFGHDIYYMPRTLVNKDIILGEDVGGTHRTCGNYWRNWMEAKVKFSGI